MVVPLLQVNLLSMHIYQVLTCCLNCCNEPVQSVADGMCRSSSPLQYGMSSALTFMNLVSYSSGYEAAVNGDSACIGCCS